VLGGIVGADVRYLDRLRAAGGWDDFDVLALHGYVRLSPEASGLGGWLDRAVAYEITTHSEHHLDAGRQYWRLTPHPKAPQMPSIILCFLLSLVPPLWNRFIAMPRLRRRDLEFASPEERALAAAANKKAGWPNWLGEARVEAVRA